MSQSELRAIKKPNLRKIIAPDPGYIICESDLAQADAQVVACEAQDEQLLDFFLRARTDKNLDLHKFNALVMGCSRQHAKQGVHATNYGATAFKVGKTLNISKNAALSFQIKWFHEHPGIKEWHKAVQHSLDISRTVRNIFGYRRLYLDRPDAILPEALAWIPQSTVALIIDKGFVRLHETMYPKVIVLQQGHDSLVYQIEKRHFNQQTLNQVRECMEVELPYPDPWIVPVGLSASEKSWGDCVEIEDWRLAA